jgi:oligopeptide transport system permease protein
MSDQPGDAPEGGVGAASSAQADASQAAASGGTDRQASLWSDAWYELRRKPIFVVSALLILLILTMAFFPGLFTNADPRACSLGRSLERPSGDHWFGFDVQGCDYYARVIYGARASIAVGTIVTGLAAVIAIVFGTLAGYYGGWGDTLIARITDLWFAIPLVLGALVLLTVIENRGVPQVAVVLAIFGWPTMLRLMRSSVLSASQADYVQAARALGASDLRIMRRHVLPNAITPVLVYATIYIGIIISAEATLTFLGVGLQLPAISWGLMISLAQRRLLEAPHLLLFPGIFLSVTVFSFILMGDALRDALDPKLR